MIGYYLEGPSLAPSKIGYHPRWQCQGRFWKGGGLYRDLRPRLVEPAENSAGQDHHRSARSSGCYGLHPAISSGGFHNQHRPFRCRARLDVNGIKPDLRLARSGANTQQAVQAVAAGNSP